MNSYEEYLEKQIELKDKEIEIYKNFIEQELGCRIKVIIESERKFEKIGDKIVRFKVITIPQSQYVIKLND